MTVEELGCCGAYCRTCLVLKAKTCLGCKSGYRAGKRDISKAKCKIKICCIKNGYASCADCNNFNSCKTIQGFYGKNGYKYKKYREALEYIRIKGYASFIRIANEWKIQYGKLTAEK